MSVSGRAREVKGNISKSWYSCSFSKSCFSGPMRTGSRLVCERVPIALTLDVFVTAFLHCLIFLFGLSLETHRDWWDAACA